jgi:hypothetical protein
MSWAFVLVNLKLGVVTSEIYLLNSVLSYNTGQDRTV